MIWVIAIGTVVFIIVVGIVGAVSSGGTGSPDSHRRSLVSRFIDWMN